MEENSILTSIKSLLGISEEDTSFDVEIMIHINTAIMMLRQIGVGPVGGYSIKSKEDTWSDFLGVDLDKCESVKTYIYIKTKLVFDPPTSSVHMEALNQLLRELEFRLNIVNDE